MRFGNREKVWNLDWALQGLEKCLNFIHGLKKAWKSLENCLWHLWTQRRQVGHMCENRPGTWGVDVPRGVKHTALYKQLKLTPAYVLTFINSWVNLLVWKKFLKFWKKVWKRYGIFMLPKRENHGNSCNIFSKWHKTDGNRWNIWAWNQANLVSFYLIFLHFFTKKLLVALLDLFGLLNNNFWACSGRPKHDLVAPGDLATI